MKGLTFGVGFGFFGDPIISPSVKWLNERFPNWQKLLELRNTIFKGVPTNAQLTITLLRIGEANKAPIPPPPRSNAPPPKKAAELSEKDFRAAGADYPLNATQQELDAAVAYDPKVAENVESKEVEAAKEHKHGKKGSKLLGFFKGTTAATVQTAISADSLKAKVGSENAKNRLGVVPHKTGDASSGPIEFQCRFQGEKGHLYLTSKATVPCVAFSPNKVVDKNKNDLHAVWSIAVGDIKELKKMGGYGWKAKLVVGWALNRHVKDGLIITNREGTSWTITAMPLRDELFNRLASMGGQKWSSW